jgi:hypothetical protein
MDLFDLKAHPNATIVHPVDPHTLSESQIKFGIADAINIFLSPFTSKRVDRAGTFLRGPSNQLFQHVTQNPEGCASQKGGG